MKDLVCFFYLTSSSWCLSSSVELFCSPHVLLQGGQNRTEPVWSAAGSWQLQLNHERKTCRLQHREEELQCVCVCACVCLCCWLRMSFLILYQIQPECETDVKHYANQSSINQSLDVSLLFWALRVCMMNMFFVFKMVLLIFLFGVWILELTFWHIIDNLMNKLIYVKADSWNWRFDMKSSCSSVTLNPLVYSHFVS